MQRIQLLLMAGHLSPSRPTTEKVPALFIYIWAAHMRNMHANFAHKDMVWIHLWSIIKFCWS